MPVLRKNNLRKTCMSYVRTMELGDTYDVIKKNFSFPQNLSTIINFLG